MSREPFVQDVDFTLYCGDALHVLGELPAESVHCVVTSPPYWGLRDYAIEPTDWPEVIYEPLPGFELTLPPATCCLGLEADPYAFVGHMVAMFRELRRVIRPEATVWLNIGDSYASKRAGTFSGSTLRGGRTYEADRVRQEDIRAGLPDRLTLDGIKPKDMVGIPWLLAFALRTDGWWLRQDVIWDKANPMPESVTDRPAKSHEPIFLLTKSERCFYDYVAVRETASGTANSRGSGLNPKALQHADASSGIKQNASAAAAFSDLTARRNLRSVWKVASRPYPGAHFAVFPTTLIEPCILAGTSARGCCSACGAPFLPVNEKRSLGRHELPADHPEYRPTRYVGKHDDQNGGGQRYLDVVTVDWEPSCSCDHPAVVPCVVLDPFMGAATTARVSRDLGRHAIGIEKSPEYAAQAADRLSQQSLLSEGAVA